MKKYLIQDRQAGNIIDEFDNKEAAQKALELYKEDDKRNGDYEPDFYEIKEVETEEAINAFELGIKLERTVKEKQNIGGSGFSYGGDYGISHFQKPFDRDPFIKEFSEKYPGWSFETMGKTGICYERKGVEKYWIAEKEQEKILYEKEGW